MMNGIDKIIGRISGDAQGEIDSILDEAKKQAADITAEYQAQAKAEADDVLARGRKAVAERGERLDSMAQLDCRKATLGTKQAVIDEAFDAAKKKLLSLPEEKYVELLTSLVVKASTTGREEVIFSQADRARVGKAVVLAANEKLGKPAAPAAAKKPATKMGAVLNRVVNGAASETAMLTLSEETRPMDGGFILVSGGTEVNCTFDTLIRLRRNELAIQVAGVLFD